MVLTNHPGLVQQAAIEFAIRSVGDVRAPFLRAYLITAYMLGRNPESSCEDLEYLPEALGRAVAMAHWLGELSEHLRVGPAGQLVLPGIDGTIAVLCHPNELSAPVR